LLYLAKEEFMLIFMFDRLPEFSWDIFACGV